ncbi:MAG TPA: hypothetical protein VN108_11005 [Marmoricola sp.]|nr:hypothetical protein [Marmoricola sp.]
MRLRSRAAALVAVPLVFSLVGCGQSAVEKYAKSDPATVDRDMRAALTSLKSVHIHTVESVSGGTFLVDISVDSSGRCAGSVGDGDVRVNLIATDTKTLYVNGSAAFWVASQKTSVPEAALLADKWLTGVRESPIVGVCDLASLVNSYAGQAVTADAPRVLGRTTVDGQDAVNLQITTGGTTVTASVSASSPHYPLKITAADGKRITELSAFNKPVNPAAPSNVQDLSKLKPAK